MGKKTCASPPVITAHRAGRPSGLLDTRAVYCGDNVERLAKLPDACIDLIYVDPPFNSNRNYEVFWGETEGKRAFEDRRATTKAFIDHQMCRARPDFLLRRT
jgi:DNA modification methylase